MKKMMIFSLLALVMLGSFVCAAEKLNLSDIPFEFQRDAAASTSPKLVVPDWMVPPARVLFNLGTEGQLTLSLLVVLFALLAVLFMVLSSVMKFVPFFEGGKAWIGAIVVSLIASLAGGIRESAYLFLSLQVKVGRLGPLWFVVVILIAFIVGLGAMKALNMLSNKLKIEQAEHTGEEVSLKPLMEKLKEKGIN